MHLAGFPHTYVKEGHAPRLACYTVEARELRADGWVRDEKASASEPDPVEEPGVPVDEIIEAVDELITAAEEMEPVVGDIDFEAMTKRELLQYAMDHGVDLPDNALKAELIEACEAI
jgi:hypothetical protein